MEVCKSCEIKFLNYVNTRWDVKNYGRIIRIPDILEKFLIELDFSYIH